MPRLANRFGFTMACAAALSLAGCQSMPRQGAMASADGPAAAMRMGP